MQDLTSWGIKDHEEDSSEKSPMDASLSLVVFHGVPGSHESPGGPEKKTGSGVTVELQQPKHPAFAGRKWASGQDGLYQLYARDLKCTSKAQCIWCLLHAPGFQCISPPPATFSGPEPATTVPGPEPTATVPGLEPPAMVPGQELAATIYGPDVQSTIPALEAPPKWGEPKAEWGLRPAPEPRPEPPTENEPGSQGAPRPGPGSLAGPSLQVKRAAFDTVNHQILLSTLSELGISGAAHAWIASYLTGRSYQVVNRISACLADISVWMTDHHLKLNLGKTELLFLPGKDCPFHDLAITVDNSIVSSSQSAKNLGVILDNTLSFSTNIKAVARSCRFMLYNIRRVRPCLTQEAAQVLIQALVISRLDYCNSLLAGLPACAIKPLQLIQNAAARLVFNLPKFSHVTPLLRSLHWLPVEARIRYKTMVLAYGAVRGTAPQYLQALIRPYTQTRALRSSTSGLLASLPLRKYSSRSAQSKLFAALAPQWWNKLPHDARTAESITTFRRHLKPHLFKEYLG
uniref:uncharacterized protein LOC124039031 n=1 Tax=Oncorhynchus gorbuscha TaxID=8017 RepID=UPI001EAF5384|nr:uncharacterized protein LOC124039031 [Oncorhynchus gorbuscha]